MKKDSIVLVSNKTPVYKLKLFHFYTQRIYNISSIGYFALSSIRKVRPNKYSQLRRRTKMKSIVFQVKQWTIRADSTKRRFFLNSVVLLKKNLLPLSSYMIGSALLDVRRRKYISYFLDVF